MKKFLLSFSLLILLSLASYAQLFQQDIAELNKWFDSIPRNEVPKGAKERSIVYKAGYCLTGLFLKGQILNGQPIKIFELEEPQRTILIGSVINSDLGLIIKGKHFKPSEKGDIVTYGEFEVANSELYKMIYKPKKAGNLMVSCKNMYAQTGYYLNCPSILFRKTSSIAVDGKTGGRTFDYIKADINDSILTTSEEVNFHDLLLTSKSMMELQDSFIFRGNITPIDKNGVITFYKRDGVDVNDKDSIIVGQENNRRCYKEFLKIVNDNIVIKSFCYYLPVGTEVPLEKMRDPEFYTSNQDSVSFVFKDNSIFDGRAKIDLIKKDDLIVSTSFALIHGKYKYPNGDVFVGDFSDGWHGTYTYTNGDQFVGNIKETVCNFPVDGVTKLADSGIELKNNWLSKFSLSNEQWEKIKRCRYPSDAYFLAKRYTENKYLIKYTPNSDDAGIQYFSLRYEKVNSASGTLTYDKRTNLYRLTKNDVRIKGHEWITKMDIMVDSEGKRLKDIVYEETFDGESSNLPTYVNIYEWYENGELSSIKSYSYSSNKIILACNFFSDGRLRSAYYYETLKNGKVVLRKSKESHPTFGGYTSKLYDLDGNYEKITDWSIGEESSFFFGNSVLKFSIQPLILSKWSKVPDL